MVHRGKDSVLANPPPSERYAISPRYHLLNRRRNRIDGVYIWESTGVGFPVCSRRYRLRPRGVILFNPFPTIFYISYNANTDLLNRTSVFRDVMKVNISYRFDRDG
jgi:hypothetical protein